MSWKQRLLRSMPILRARARRLTADPAAADDLLQESLARALASEHALRDPERMEAWLLAIQRNTHLNQVRRERLLQAWVEERGGEAEPSVSPATPETALLAGALGDEVQAALRALPEAWRRALWLREVDGLSYDEIAAEQGCPVGTVRSRLARARQAMLQRLQGGGADGSL